MFILRFLRYLRGYVKFRAEGVFIERFLNLVARDRISVWDGRKRGDVYTGYVSASSYGKMRVHAKKTGVRIRVAGKEGVPFHRRRYRKRTGLLVGLGLFAAFLLTMSGFIWRVEINGNQAVSEDRIAAVLEEVGVKPGSLRRSINVRQAEQRTLLALEELSWVAVNIDGSVAYIEVTERVEPPEMVDPDKPCNIVADKAGQITLLRVYDGEPLVQKGDTVLPGDIIVSGIMQDRLGQNRLKHALADIEAQVNHTVTLSVPLAQTEYRETGETKSRNYLSLFSFELPVFWPSSIPGPYRVERDRGAFTLFSLELPLGYLKEEYILMEEVPVTLTEEQAKDQALEELALIEQVELEDAEILGKTITAVLENDVFYLQAEYVAHMRIGVSREILHEDTDE